MKKILLVLIVSLLLVASPVFAAILSLGQFQDTMKQSITGSLSSQQQQQNFDSWYTNVVSGQNESLANVAQQIETGYSSAESILSECIKQGVLTEGLEGEAAEQAVDKFIQDNPAQAWTSLVASVQNSINAVKSANEELAELNTDIVAQEVARDLAL